MKKVNKIASVIFLIFLILLFIIPENIRTYHFEMYEYCEYFNDNNRYILKIFSITGNVIFDLYLLYFVIMLRDHFRTGNVK